jgi:hypothetical protein
METPPYEVMPFNRDKFLDAVRSSFMTRAQVESHEGAAYLENYLSEIGAKTMVVENDYTDADYLDDFANYYVKSYVQYERHCRRLHFFSISFDEARFLSEIVNQSTASEEFLRSYLGFIVARPLPSAIIGRTVLQTYDSDGTHRNYPTTKQYSAHLFGCELSVNSLAFQEQDTVLAACATVALWSAFQKTSALFETSASTPAQITRAATSAVYSSRPLPSKALRLEQMARAVRAVGLEPEVISAGPQVPIMSLIYGYLQLGVPVVLILNVEGDGHAVTVAGYSLKDNPAITREDWVDPTPPLRRVGLRIDELYVHDDGVGPFARIKVVERSGKEPKKFAVYFEGDWVDSAGSAACLEPRAIIVPVYHKIRLTFLDLQDWVNQFNAVAELEMKDFDEGEWLFALTDTNDFKVAVKVSSLPASTRKRVLLRELPRFVWTATFSVAGKAAVQLVFDATGMTRSVPVLDVLYFKDDVREAVAKVLASGAEKLLHERFLELLREKSG